MRATFIMSTWCTADVKNAMCTAKPVLQLYFNDVNISQPSKLTSMTEKMIKAELLTPRAGREISNVLL